VPVDDVNQMLSINFVYLFQALYGGITDRAAATTNYRYSAEIAQTTPGC
jgi:hypothetical protein